MTNVSKSVSNILVSNQNTITNENYDFVKLQHVPKKYKHTYWSCAFVLDVKSEEDWYKFKSIFIIPELRKRIFFTLGVLIVARLGAHIPIPGINGEALSAAFQGYQNTLLGLYNLFAGGAFEKATLFALGIMPYISSSIIVQLMTGVSDYFKNLKEQGELGRKKITQITRYGTVFIAALQGLSLIHI